MGVVIAFPRVRRGRGAPARRAIGSATVVILPVVRIEHQCVPSGTKTRTLKSSSGRKRRRRAAPP